jgi:hypothetical protein
MVSLDFLDKPYVNFSKKLLDEAKPILTGEPLVWNLPMEKKVSTGETLTENIKAQIPLIGGKFRPDMLVCHDLPTAKGMLHVVFPYAPTSLMVKATLLPIDLLFRINGKIPRAVVLKSGFLSPDWHSATGSSVSKPKDDFCAFLDQVKVGKESNIKSSAKWKLNTKEGWDVKLEWAMQLVPLSDSGFLFISHQPYYADMFGQFKVYINEYLKMVNWIESAIGQLNYTGQASKPEVLVHTFGLMAISEIAGDLRPKSAVTSEAPKTDKENQDKRDPLAIAKERLAKGEITPDEFAKIKALLESK